MKSKAQLTKALQSQNLYKTTVYSEVTAVDIR